MSAISSLLWWCAAAALVAAPVLLLRFRHGAGWRWFFLGIAAYVISMGAKAALYYLGNAVGLAALPAGPQAAVTGAGSAFAELSAAALFLRRGSPKLADALAFGVGAGAFEALFAMAAGWAELADATHALPSPARLAAAIGFPFFVERGLTLVGHAASRALIYAALQRRWLLPAALAFITFTLVDGVAQYGELAHWDWGSTLVVTRYYLFMGCVTAVEVGAAWILLRARQDQAISPP
jgi:hypothetical protein